MEYWRGGMDWALDKDWVCYTCDQNAGLEWGMIHTQCRCNNCHTEYTMRADDEERTVLTVPKCMIKDEYKEPLRKAYKKHQTPIDNITMDMIEEYKEVTQ